MVKRYVSGHILAVFFFNDAIKFGRELRRRIKIGRLHCVHGVLRNRCMYDVKLPNLGMIREVRICGICFT